jgi:hypothetical protein
MLYKCGQEKQPHRKNRADKVSFCERHHHGMKHPEKPIQLITILLASSLTPPCLPLKYLRTKREMICFLIQSLISQGDRELSVCSDCCSENNQSMDFIYFLYNIRFPTLCHILIAEHGHLRPIHNGKIGITPIVYRRAEDQCSSDRLERRL